MLRSCSIALALSLLALPCMAQESSPEPPSEAPVTLPPLDQRSELSAGNLARQLPAAEQQMLQVGDETVLALWRPANTSQAKGVIILLPDAGESADWPRVISPLRQRLPDAGWHSLSLTLPDLPELPLANAEEPASNGAPSADSTSAAPSSETSTADPSNTQAETEEAPQPSAKQLNENYQDQINERLQAALAFAKTQEAAEVILLGHGQSAFWAMAFVATEKPTDVTRLALIAPSVPLGFDIPLEEQLSALQLPIGDFYYKDQPLDREQALLRLNISKRTKRTDYSQVGLKALPGNREVEQEQLYRRIRGWLDKSTLPAPRKQR